MAGANDKPFVIVSDILGAEYREFTLYTAKDSTAHRLIVMLIRWWLVPLVDGRGQSGTAESTPIFPLRGAGCEHSLAALTLIWRLPVPIASVGTAILGRPAHGLMRAQAPRTARMVGQSRE